ncbi:MAG TPA: MFS transporter [Motilibacteraceae bacterium]|nr:MFS transporter [Motilibacteraceae bacterium]
MKDVLRHRDARLLLTGQAVSVLGDWLLLLVLGIWVKELTGSTAAAGSVFLAMSAPVLLSPAIGVLVDRVRRRRLLVAADLLMAVVVLSLVAVRDAGDVWIVYAVAASYGLSLSVVGSGTAALVQSMLPAELVGPTNAASQTVRQSLRLVGPLAGTALYAALGPGAVAVLDSATFVVSAGALALLSVRETRPERGGGQHVLAEAAAGVRHLVHAPVLRTLLVSSVLLTAAFGMVEVLAFAVVDRGLHRPAEFLAVLVTVQGVGAVAGGASSARVMARWGELRLVVVGLVGCAAGLATLVAPVLPVVLVGMVLMGAAMPMTSIGTVTALQHRTENALMGRVMSGFELLSTLPYTLSVALGAGLVALVDYRLLLLAIAASATAAALFAALHLRETAAAPRRDHAEMAGPQAGSTTGSLTISA